MQNNQNFVISRNQKQSSSSGNQRKGYQQCKINIDSNSKHSKTFQNKYNQQNLYSQKGARDFVGSRKESERIKKEQNVLGIKSNYSPIQGGRNYTQLQGERPIQIMNNQ